eukprot:3729956-Prymnesium_polylepis.1
MVAADGTVTFGRGTFIFSRFVADVGALRSGMPYERLNVTRGFWYHSREPSSLLHDHVARAEAHRHKRRRVEGA